MEPFIVSARKYRPATFDTVVGQSHITSTLKNAIRTGQLAQAYLFCGPRGVGKTTCARIFAKTINCQQPTSQVEACGSCAACMSFQQSASFNIHELDAASNNSVEDIRYLVDQVRYPPQHGRYKVYIIDEVHMLSNAAFNAFLKTLEEPPPYAIFILATTEKHKILPTILSRCQVYDFHRIQVRDIVRYLQKIALQEQVHADEAALHLIARKADGGLRDALSMFDLLVTFSANRHITYEQAVEHLHVLDYDYYFRIVDALLQQDTAAALLLLEEILQKGFDAQLFVAGLQEHLRNLMISQLPDTLLLLEVPETVKPRFQQQASQISQAWLMTALDMAHRFELEFRYVKNAKVHTELLLLKLTYLQDAIELAQQPTLPTEKKNDLSQSTTGDNPQQLKRSVRSTPRLNQLTHYEHSSAKEAPLAASASVQAEKEEEAKPEQAISLSQAWQQLQQAYKDDQNLSLLLAKEYRLEGNTIYLPVEAQVLAKSAEKYKPEWKKFLQEKTQQHYNIELEVISTEQEHHNSSISFYSTKEKLLYMLKHYPQLKDILEQLDLQKEL